MSGTDLRESIASELAGSKHKVPNLERGLSVIELLSEHPEGLIGSEIAGTIGIPRNSAARILAALSDRNFIEFASRTRKYFLTRKLMFLGRSFILDQSLIEEALEEMRALRDRLGETILLSCCTLTDGVILEQVPALHQVRLTVDPGTRFGLYCSSPGKLMLASLDDGRLDEALSQIKLTPLTDATITDVAELRSEIGRIRQCGYAVDREEGFNGVCCVSASIKNRKGRHIAELTVTGLSSSLPPDRFEELAIVVRKHAGNISRRLGYE